MRFKYTPLWLIRQLLGPWKALLWVLRGRIVSSIRVQLILTFIICLLLAVFAGAFASDTIDNSGRGEAYIEYTKGKHQIDEAARDIVRKLDEMEDTQAEAESIQEHLDNATEQHSFKLIIADVDGKVLYKSPNAKDVQVDLYNVINQAMSLRTDQYDEKQPQEFSSFYPSVIKETKVFVIGTGLPEPNIAYTNNGDEAALLSILIGFVVFILSFQLITKRKMKYIEELAAGLRVISTGNLDHRIASKGSDELASLAGNINSMAEELQCTIEEERRAEKTKNELITNISHDLRTPLTSITGYLKLVSDKKYEDEKQLEDFIGIALGKAEKLKTLIDDLFEYTKIANKGVRLNISDVNINELLEQLVEELVPASEENGLQFVKEISHERIVVPVDADLTVRVFENLLMNAITYSHKPGEILVRITRQQGKALVCIENKGDSISKEELPNLFNRFYRLEKSRSSDTGGSGLGLAIAKNIVELHHGEIWADCKGDRIRFFVELPAR